MRENKTGCAGVEERETPQAGACQRGGSRRRRQTPVRRTPPAHAEESRPATPRQVIPRRRYATPQRRSPRERVTPAASEPHMYVVAVPRHRRE